MVFTAQNFFLEKIDMRIGNRVPFPQLKQSNFMYRRKLVTYDASGQSAANDNYLFFTQVPKLFPCHSEIHINYTPYPSATFRISSIEKAI
jgi:hypothetical protein